MMDITFYLKEVPNFADVHSSTVIPRIGEEVELSGMCVRRVYKVIYRYSDNGVSHVNVHLENY